MVLSDTGFNYTKQQKGLLPTVSAPSALGRFPVYKSLIVIVNIEYGHRLSGKKQTFNRENLFTGSIVCPGDPTLFQH